MSNTISFTLNWQNKFTNFSQLGKFTRIDKTKVLVPIMKVEKVRLLYAHNPLDLPLKVCQFPCAGDSAFCLTVLLPEKAAIGKVEEALNIANFKHFLGEMEEKTASTIFPEVEIKSKIDMERVVKEMGKFRISG